MSFHVGQRVVCVDDRKRGIKGKCPFAKGVVYVVERVGEMGGRVYVDIEGIRRAKTADHPAWRADRFRPLDERRLDVFRAMLAPRPRERATT